MNEQSSANQSYDRREARRQCRAERFGYSSRGGTSVFGLILVLLGGALLLQNMGVLSVSFTNWWALFILLPASGAFQRGWSMYRQAENHLTAPVLGSFLVGVVLLMVTATFLFNLNWSLIGPALLILAGVGTLFAAFSTGK